MPAAIVAPRRPNRSTDTRTWGSCARREPNLTGFAHSWAERSSRCDLIPAVFTLLLLSSPAIANGQTFAVQASGSPTMTDPGHSLAAGFAFSPTSHLALMVDVERTHLSSQIHTDARGVTSAFRGGTVTLVAPALRVSLLGGNRVGPYGLIGLAAGVSRPNVTDLFPSRVAR